MDDKRDMGPFARMDPELEQAVTAYGTPPVREMITINVRNIDDYQFDDLPDTPNAMIDWITAACAEAPPEYQNQLKFSLQHDAGYYDDNSRSDLRIWYDRPETDDEMRKRVGRGINYVRQHEAAERTAYERLKARFEPDAGEK